MRFGAGRAILKDLRHEVAAAPAASADAQLDRQLLQRAGARAGALLDLTVGDCVADTDIQSALQMRTIDILHENNYRLHHHAA